MIALGMGFGLTLFNYIFGQSLDPSKYVTSTMLFVYIVIIIGMVWSIRFKTIRIICAISSAASITINATAI